MIAMLRKTKANGIQQATRVGDAVLYCGDSARLQPHIGRVDAVITDPPYSPRTHRNAKTNKAGAVDKQLVTFDALGDAAFMAAACGWLASAHGWCVVTCDYRHAALLFDWPEFVRLGAWVKRNPVPQLTGDRPGQGFETVVILHAGRRRKAWNRRGGPAVWHHPVCNKASVPTQKPLALIADFVADFTVAGEVVLDPFMGSGTTGEACLRAGRRFIGIEQDPERYAIAVKRLRSVVTSIGRQR